MHRRRFAVEKFETYAPGKTGHEDGVVTRWGVLDRRLGGEVAPDGTYYGPHDYDRTREQAQDQADELERNRSKPEKWL